MCAWRCAFIILETDGLTLSEFNRVVSGVCFGQVSDQPYYIFRFTCNGAFYHCCTNPLQGSRLAGSRKMVVNTKTVRYDNTMVRRDDQWYWFLECLHNRQIFAKRALGFSTIAWTNSQADNETCRHVMSNDVWMPPNSVVENATIPCLIVRGITWNKRQRPI